MNSGNMQIESNNLKVISDQLNHECLMNKKYSLYSNYCTDPQLKNLCTQAAMTHKQNFNELKAYLDSHQ
ncbi:hypothetical protein [Clostridium cochlearium]|uniref:hypothetical protein n=1 Tax=Clostridium cochlearium TaxID=1494 RepID=UPI001EDF31FF|nr:hypothetical protein [Clostridium cochlearium]MBV1821441.1 hypothetical protein [Bacteroidales bacterium MSK.15.36]MCG4571522.1 hypothetical protein [Clostridium cochlearium]MCG4579983.1 hypothetical protein [Clostridium cochlearium]MCR1972225.1 hypothetical protein [Clostridium cochlearium]